MYQAAKATLETTRFNVQACSTITKVKRKGLRKGKAGGAGQIVFNRSTANEADLRTVSRGKCTFVDKCRCSHFEQLIEAETKRQSQRCLPLRLQRRLLNRREIPFLHIDEEPDVNADQNGMVAVAMDVDV